MKPAGRSTLIGYPPEALRAFHCYVYEWIDNLNFCMPVRDAASDWQTYVQEAHARLACHGWNGEGEVALLWLPPFSLKGILEGGAAAFLDHAGRAWTNGLILWHVKQEADGTSFLLSPVELDLPDFGID
ncbi:hypothetical protein [Burkholderia sp. F1]|uniref:hypothetical protein n=1 Tax=Burkholderia sp. F1 TaxID=3366817 RepID=UPI003D751784